MQNDQPILMPRERRVEQLPGKQPAWVRQHDEGRAEFAALRLVDRQTIGEFKYRSPIVPKLRLPETVLAPTLTCEFHFDVLRQPAIRLASFLVVSDDDPDVAVSNVCLPFPRKYASIPSLISDVDDLVAV